VPKAGKESHSYLELQEYWETVVKPLFGREDLVQQRLVRIRDSAVISRLNTTLKGEEDIRRPDFRGSQIAQAEYAMLVEDMRQRRLHSLVSPFHFPASNVSRVVYEPDHPEDLVLEFKPKWLAQSPNAPKGATRCRTCAHKAYKRHTKLAANNGTSTKTGHNTTILCPLGLLASGSSPSSLVNVISHFSSPNPPLTPRAPTPQQQARFAHWLQTNTLLPRVRAAQLANDRAGPLAADAHDPRFQLAMTLRDCTCFVRIRADPSAPVQAKLGDLDKKNWAAKLGYWQATERQLIDGGYYDGREEPRQTTDCQLGKIKAEIE
jgi:inositol-pentakisphosphate 2-kinase